MSRRFAVTFVLTLLVAGVSTGAGPREPERRIAPSDSALAEMEASRFWHAARLLRAEGMAQGGPEDVLLLATAEAGWENWPAVLELLNGASWLDAETSGRGFYLIGRAHEQAGDWSRAAQAYGRYVQSAGPRGADVAPALSRRAQALWRAGDHPGALAALGALLSAPAIRSWTAYELLVDAAAAGDTAGVRALLIHVPEPGARDALWSVEADALLASGDTARAAAAFRTLRGTHEGVRRAHASLELGRLVRAAGDTAAARPLLLEAYRLGQDAAQAEAAQALLDLGGWEEGLTLDLARTVDRAGDGARALAAYDRVARAAAAGTAELPEWARLERARLMATVRARQDEALEEFRAIRETTSDERIGARNLEVWRGMRERQGLDAQVATLRRWLVEEHPGSPEAVEVVWREGTAAEDRGQLDVALARYAHIAEHARTSARAGEGRMRSGQIHLRRGNREAAARVFEAYLEDFPDGRRWQEAAFWAGRVRLEMGDTARGRAHLERAMREPVEYYAVLAAELLDVPYRVDVPEGLAPSVPLWLAEGLERLDRLREAGLDRGAETEIVRLRERAQGARGPMLALAEALIDRGRTIDGINLGWALLEQEGSWDRQILRVTFPFPYRELVRREAEEWGIDPFMLAAIIRQESAFSADIVSRAGAIGLMQVMPPTGAQVARAHGPWPFTEEVLARPEVNLHLGAAFFVDMSRRYDHDLALVLSAYNAGPTRATRWRAFPEASDTPVFTERIPIVETRGYVKSVRRNLGLYKALYGEE